MAQLTDAERRDVAAAAAAVRRAAAQSLVTANLKAGTKVKLADLDDACAGDAIDERFALKHKLLRGGLLDV